MSKVGNVTPRFGWTSLLLILEAPSPHEVLEYFVPGARVPDDLLVAANRLVAVDDAAPPEHHWAAFDRFIEDVAKLSEPDREAAERLRSSLAWITSEDHVHSSGMMMLIALMGQRFIERLPAGSAANVNAVVVDWSSARRLIGLELPGVAADDGSDWQAVLGSAMDRLAANSIARELRTLPDADRQRAVDALEQDAQAKGVPHDAISSMIASLREIQRFA